MSNPQPATLNDADLERLMRSDVRRTTMLAAWFLSLLYVCVDLALRWGDAARIAVAGWLAAGLRGALWLQILAFLVSLPLIWVLCYLADPSIEAAGRRSWLYRMGNLAHSRLFLLVYLALLIAGAIAAIDYGVSLSSFWLICAVLLLSCLIGLVEPGDGLQTGLRNSWFRLTLLLVRLPLIGRMVSLRGLNNQVQAGLTPPDDPASVEPDETQPPLQPAPPAANRQGADGTRREDGR
jgi:hypothetical protein